MFKLPFLLMQWPTVKMLIQNTQKYYFEIQTDPYP